MSSLSNHIRRDVADVTRRMTNFELSETASYMDNYIAALFLPQTEINQFPKLKARREMHKSDFKLIGLAKKSARLAKGSNIGWD